MSEGWKQNGGWGSAPSGKTVAASQNSVKTIYSHDLENMMHRFLSLVALAIFCTAAATTQNAVAQEAAASDDSAATCSHGDCKGGAECCKGEGDSCCKGEGSCCKGEGSCCKGEGSCPVSEAMTQLPKMTYKVGDESTCCSDSAEALAKKNEEEIIFVVADKEYADRTEAMTALADATEEYVDSFTRFILAKSTARHWPDAKWSARKAPRNWRATCKKP